MSKLTENLFHPPSQPREMTARARAVYLLLGVLAALALATAYWSSHQLLHQALTSAGIYGMVALRAVGEVRRRGWRAYCRCRLVQDAVVAAVWTALLVIWMLDPNI